MSFSLFRRKRDGQLPGAAKIRADEVSSVSGGAKNGGRLIVLSAPLTEAIDYAGYFIQMAMASMPIWMEPVINSKYPSWRNVERNPDGTACYMPAGVRLLQTSLLREWSDEDIAVCYPDDLHQFIGAKTRVVAVSTHNPLGVTFAAGVYTSIFGSSRLPINSHYARLLFAIIKNSPYRPNFKVIVGGSGGWQITQTNSFVPDLNPQIDFPKEKIMKGVHANVREGNRQISLATEDMFIWGQVRTETPFFFPNREALVDLYSSIVRTPGVEQHVLSHCTIAPFVVDPLLIKELSQVLLPKSPIHLPRLSSHPQGKALSPLVGLETGSVPMAKKIMPSKGVPFSIDDWPSVVLEGLRVANENNWFPVMTLMVGNPGETDEDSMATLDLIYEMECRGLFAFLVPSIFTPLHDTRMEKARGVTETQSLTPLQWQVMMKSWKLNLRPAMHSWWGPMAWRVGSIAMWLYKLRRLNGPNFTWPLFMFSGVISEEMLRRMGKIYIGKPLKIKTRKELIASVRSNYWRYFRVDNGDLPDGYAPDAPTQQTPEAVATLA